MLKWVFTGHRYGECREEKELPGKGRGKGQPSNKSKHQLLIGGSYKHHPNKTNNDNYS